MAEAAAEAFSFSVLGPVVSTESRQVVRKQPSTLAIALSAADIEDVEDRALALEAEGAYRAGKLDVLPYDAYRKRRGLKKRD